MTLKAKQRSFLKSQAHNLKPIVIIGNQGLTENVIKEINRALTDHELIKIKIASQAREERKAIAEEAALQLEAELVQTIGQIAVLYRENPEEE